MSWRQSIVKGPLYLPVCKGVALRAEARTISLLLQHHVGRCYPKLFIRQLSFDGVTSPTLGVKQQWFQVLSVAEFNSTNSLICGILLIIVKYSACLQVTNTLFICIVILILFS